MTSTDELRPHATGQTSARSLLWTILGEYVLPYSEPVWTATYLRAMDVLGIEEKAARQTLARLGAQGWLAPERNGRRTRWALTTRSMEVLTEGTERIYSFGRHDVDWDGEWLVLLASVPEAHRDQRYQLRTRLSWAGFGALGQGAWISPHTEREPEARAALAEVGLTTALLFRGTLADAGTTSPDHRVTDAWDLSSLAGEYRDFVDHCERLSATVTEDTTAAFAAHTELVHRWRGFPFSDPDLPAPLLPPDWIGGRARVEFHRAHRLLEPAARAWWQAAANGEVV